MRRPVADPAAVLTGVTGRVDTVERELADLHQDVTALGRGVAGLIAQLRQATPTATGRPHTGADPVADTDPDSDLDSDLDPDPDSDADIVDGEGEVEGQRDWFAVTDPGQARDWLSEVTDWAGRVLAWHGLDLSGIPCWPLHPCVVGDLLALVAQREHAYAQDDPTPVMEWATRWLPAGITRIHSRLHHCAQDHAHHHTGHLLDATGLTSENGLTDTATWWTTARAVPGPDWLHLPPLN